MHADEHVLAVADVAAHERDVRLLVELVLEGVDAGSRRTRSAASPCATRLHQRLGAHPVLDQIRDRDHQQAVLASRTSPARGTRAIVPSSFMISQITPAGIEPGDAREVDGRFGLARRAPARRRRARAAGTCGRAARDRDGLVAGSIAASTVAARSAAEMPVVVPRLRVDRHAERRSRTREVFCDDHQRNLELVEPLGRHRQADQPAAVASP